MCRASARRCCFSARRFSASCFSSRERSIAFSSPLSSGNSTNLSAEGTLLTRISIRNSYSHCHLFLLVFPGSHFPLVTRHTLQLRHVDPVQPGPPRTGLRPWGERIIASSLARNSTEHAPAFARGSLKTPLFSRLEQRMNPSRSQLRIFSLSHRRERNINSASLSGSCPITVRARCASRRRTLSLPLVNALIG